MNMKKTIAAIAAGAVAVSAMATTVSALDAKTLTYNLVKSTKNDDASVVLTATFPNIELESGTDVEIEIPGYAWGDEITIRGNYKEEGLQVVQITSTENTWSEKYNPALIPSWASATSYKVTIPVKDTNTTDRVAFMGGSAGTVTTPHEDAVDEAAVVKACNLNNTGTPVTDKTKVTSVTAPALNSDGTSKVVTDSTSGTINAGDTADVTLTYDGSKWEDDDSNVWTVVKDAGVTLDNGDTITVTYTSPKAEVDEVRTGATSVHANITVEVAKKNLTQKNISEVNDALYNQTLGIKLKNGAAAAIWGATNASNFNGNGVTKHPFRSTLTGSTNVITSVWNTEDESALVNSAAIQAVINDAVVNYSDVVFQFNTAVKNVKVFWATDVSDGGKKKFVDAQYTDDGVADYKADGTWQAGDYNGDWAGDGKYVEVVDCKSFARHFWDSDPGYDANTIYIGRDWLGNNLFEGALIINGGLTLSLSATDKFDWTSTSLSFSWDAIQDAALTTNQYANYIQSMVLRTSADWYWDNFQVVLGATEDEDVGTTSPVEAEDEELEESEPEVEAEPEEEEEPEVEAEPEEEPEVAPVASNPGTGNAPVALAVIPVALAAAAVVAKKRG
ncbi:MAG: hypothetical protein HDT25_09640 [Ruminococcus sp.]|nr:hypothetical protein [Ruminococcus sp.]